MSKNPKARRAIALLLLLALALFAYPASAQGPEKVTVTEAGADLSSESSFSVEADKSESAEPATEAPPAAEPGAAPLLEGPTAGQTQSVPQTAPTFAVAANSGELVSIIVELEDEALAAYTGGLPGLAPTSPVATGAEKLDTKSAPSQAYLNYLVSQQDAFAVEVDKTSPSAQIIHRYQAVLNGVSVVLPANQVAQISRLPGVKAVYPDQLLQLTTDTTPSFIGANRIWKDLGGQGKAGEGVVVGILDTGIWPEHPSFSNPDPNGKPYAAPPNGTGGYGCQFGSATPGDAAFSCNNKLIGAYRFMATYDLFGPALLPGEFISARDDNGHGSHTASTAAGNANVAASIFGRPFGKISGIAPRAYVIAFKVCGDEGCFASDSAAAVEQAILDGVDVINFSIGGGTNPFSDISELAFLDAYNAGIFVAASAGNTGPGADTTGHRGPWVTTVAASTADRAFKNSVTLFGGGGSTLQISGTSLTLGISTPKLVAVPASDPFCIGPFAAGTFTDQIVVCQRGGGPGRVQKGFNVLQGGAVGMILYNNAPNVTDLETDNHFLPTTHIQFSEGQQVLAFVAANPGATATLTTGVKSTQQGDVMASFSSRGGPGQTLGVNKPDVTAPGVQILAGHSPLSVDIATGPQGQLFQAIAGTSMSSPHVAGAAALLKDLHPDWTPGQIKSALMTTAKTSGVFKEDGVTQANPYDYGAGRIDLRKAGDPGITFDETGANYLALEDALWNANYPSFYHPALPGKITVSRTARSVLNANHTWTLTTATDRNDWKIFVPATIHVPANGQTTFDITVDASLVPLGEVRHGEIRLTDGFGKLHIPVSFVRGEAAVSIAKDCEPKVIKKGTQASTCTITLENTSFAAADINLRDQIPSGLDLVPSSVVGANVIDHNVIGFSGNLAGAQPPQVNVAVDPAASPAGYLPLSLFGGTLVVGGTSDESISNFNVPAFQFAGETYTRIGIVSNGYIVVGGGTGADVDFVNSNLPDPTPPNNVLAPFWTDLNPATGGRILINTLTDGVNSWIVVEWEAIRNFGDGQANTFQVWIGFTQADDISFTYGTVSDGDGGFLTVGAENVFGNSGGTVYFDGTGTPPSPSFPVGNYEVDVFTSPGAPGQSHTVTFQMTGWQKGKWTNCAEVTSNLFQGVGVDCDSGQVK